MACVSSVVYKISLPCNRCYLGQTGRCINIRLREHHYLLKATVGGHLLMHCRDCKCRPDFSRVIILGAHRERGTREVIEAIHISCHGKSCVSEPSLPLSFLREKCSNVVQGSKIYVVTCCLEDGCAHVCCDLLRHYLCFLYAVSLIKFYSCEYSFVLSCVFLNRCPRFFLPVYPHQVHPNNLKNLVNTLFEIFSTEPL